MKKIKKQSNREWLNTLKDEDFIDEIMFIQVYITTKIETEEESDILTIDEKINLLRKKLIRWLKIKY